MKRTILAAVLGIVCTLSILSILGVDLAQAGSGAGAINLTFPIGARYNALGESGTALAQDATAIWWNAGGLAFVPTRPERRDLHLMGSKLAAGLADDIGLYWLGFAAPLGKVGAIGFAFNRLDMGEQTAVGEDQEVIGTFGSGMQALSVCFGARVSSNIGLGLTATYFWDKLADDAVLQDGGGGSGSSFGFNIGMLGKIPLAKSSAWFRGLNIGVQAANLSTTDITHVDADQSDPMPRKLQGGLALSVFSTENFGLLLTGDYQVPLYKWKDDDYGWGFETDQNEWGVGAEMNIIRSLFGRIGYKSAEYGEIEAATYGVGFDLKRPLNLPVTFDMAWVPQAKGLPKVTRISLSGRF